MKAVTYTDIPPLSVPEPLDKLGKMFGRGWYMKLKPFLESNDFKFIGRELKKMENITPSFDRTFKGFELCPYEKLKVVILSVNSYEKEMGGVALSGKGQYDILTKVMDQCIPLLHKPNENLNNVLLRWSQQGILLLNCDLTSIKGKIGHHLELWRPFIEYLLKTLAEYNTGIIYVTMGKYAETYRKFINLKQNDLIPLEHPMISIAESRPWNHEDVFEYINRVSNFINNEKIIW